MLDLSGMSNLAAVPVDTWAILAISPLVLIGLISLVCCYGNIA